MFENQSQIKSLDFSNYNFITQQDQQYGNELSSNHNEQFDNYQSLISQDNQKTPGNNDSNLNNEDYSLYLSNNFNQNLYTQTNNFDDCQQDIINLQKKGINQQLKNNNKVNNGGKALAKKIKKNQRQKIYREKENNMIMLLQKEICYNYQFLEYLQNNQISQNLQTLQNMDILQEEYQNYYERYSTTSTQLQGKKKYLKHKYQNREEYQQDLKKRNNQTAQASRQKKLDKIEQLNQLKQKFADLIVNIPVSLLYQVQSEQQEIKHSYCICQQENNKLDSKLNSINQNSVGTDTSEQDFQLFLNNQIQDTSIAGQNIQTQIERLEENNKSNNSNQISAELLQNQLQQFLNNKPEEQVSSDFYVQQVQSEDFEFSPIHYQKQQQKQQPIQSNRKSSQKQLLGSGIFLLICLFLIIQLISGQNANNSQLVQDILNFFRNITSPPADKDMLFYKQLEIYEEKKQQWERMNCQTSNERYNKQVEEYDFCISNFQQQVQILQQVGDLEKVESLKKTQMENYTGQNQRRLEAVHSTHYSILFFKGVSSFLQGHSDLSFQLFEEILQEDPSNLEDERFMVEYLSSKILSECEPNDQECYKKELYNILEHMENMKKQPDYYQGDSANMMILYLNYYFNYDLYNTFELAQQYLTFNLFLSHKFTLVQYSLSLLLEIYYRIEIYRDYQYCTTVLYDLYQYQKKVLIPNSYAQKSLYRTYQMCSYYRYITEVEEPNLDQFEIIITKLINYRDYNSFKQPDLNDYNDIYDMEQGIKNYFE